MINIIQLGKLRKTTRKEHVTRKGEMTNAFGVLVEKL